MVDVSAALRDGGLCLWVLVCELDTVLVIAARENLDFALDVCACNSFLRFFCWLTANIRLEFKAQFRAGNSKVDIIRFKEDNQFLKEIKSVGCNEELRVVVHEAITIFINLELLPGLFAVLGFQIILGRHSTSSVHPA